MQNAAIIAMMVKVKYRGVAQLGSALLWGSRGRGFESRRSDLQETRSLSGFLVVLLGFASLALLGISPSCWVIFEHFSYDLGMSWV